MPAIDTIAASYLVAGGTFGTGVFAAGDPSFVRSFPQSAFCRLLAVNYGADAAGNAFRIRSPLLHDQVQGIRFIPGETPANVIFPAEAAELLNPQDGLTVELSTTAAVGVSTAALMLYYSSLPGASARLFSPSDVMPLVKHIKPVLVTIGLGANTANVWFDASLTLTENLLKANTDYAVLGIVTNTPVACLAIRGSETGNLRIGVPGSVRSEVTQDYFVRLSEKTGLPCIPVINSANAAATVVSLIHSAATGAASQVQVILAQLSQNLG